MRFTGQVVIVTGAARGIGRATALRFLEEGAQVVAADVDAPALAGLADPACADRLRLISCDVAVQAEVEALVQTAVEAFGRVDVMVNNAGIAPVLDFLAITEAVLDRVLAVNLKGALFGTQAAARRMIAQGGGGVIINMSSINSGLANPSVAPYAISKAGMNQLTATAAVALAPHDIRVVGVGPGTIDTEMVQGAFMTAAGAEAVLSRTPLGRLGRPEEIAATVAFLASSDASYFTGETIYPDGGRRVLNYTVPLRTGG